MNINSLDSLNPVQVSAIREIVNIGLGHSATALAEITGHRFEISVPVIDSMPASSCADYVGGPETPVTGIMMPFEGEADGHLAFLFPLEAAQKLITLLVGACPESMDQFGELEISVLLEIGNILNGNFLNAIADMTSTRLLATPPSVGVEMAASLVNTIVSEAEDKDALALAIETTLQDDATEISGFFLFIPTRESLALLLLKLGLAEAA